jgi:uncharacterized lipoprotein YmbA
MNRLACALLAAGLLAGCAGNPTPAIYVLSTPTSAPVSSSSGGNLPVLQVRIVSVPDYLDSTDILLRVGPNELKASPTGRWGERLSRGITTALAANLASRLPGTLVAAGPSLDTPSRQLQVDVEAFDVQADGRSVLAARWSVLSGDARTVRSSGRATFTVPAKGQASDSAIVAAMTEAVGQLADSTAAALRAP